MLRSVFILRVSPFKLSYINIWPSKVEPELLNIFKVSTAIIEPITPGNGEKTPPSAHVSTWFRFSGRPRPVTAPDHVAIRNAKGCQPWPAKSGHGQL